MNRAIADWYVGNLLEQSRGGTEQHIKASYNIGKIAHGYRAYGRMSLPILTLCQGRHRIAMAN
jgi:hypothetical protein